MNSFLRSCLVALLCVLSSTLAVHAQSSPGVYSFNQTSAVSTCSAGVENLPANYFHATFDTNTNRFRWEADFAANTNNGQLPQGFFLVLDNGPLPRGQPGQFVIFYFDASVLASPILTVYGYAGGNPGQSYLDGSSDAGIQPPDRIRSSLLTTDWINTLQVTGDTTHRTFTFEVDASVFRNHTPLYPDPMASWYGVGFDTSIGYWFHVMTNLSTSYSNGYLTDFYYGTGFPDNYDCWDYDSLTLDCLGVPGGNAHLDNCGQCNGNNSCFDCAGTPFGTAVRDRCDVCQGDGNSCLGCTEKDNTSNLLALDSQALAQRQVVYKGLALLVDLKGDDKQARHFVRSAKTSAQKLYLASWVAAWTQPVTVRSCTSVAFCFQSDEIGIQLAKYKSGVNGLRTLLSTVTNRLKRSGAKPRKIAQLTREGDRLLKASLASAAAAPQSSSTCH